MARRLLGRKKNEAPPPTLEEATTNISTRVEGVDAKIEKLDKDIKKLALEMKRARGPQKQRLKQRALQLLRQKRTYEKMSMDLSNQAFNMEQASFAQSTLKDTVVTVNAMKSANKSLKTQFKKMSIPDIESVQDEMSDLLQDSNEIQEILGESFSMDMDFDDEDLDAELDSLGALDLETEMGTEIPSYLQDPSLTDALTADSVPTTETGEAAVDEYGLAIPTT